MKEFVLILALFFVFVFNAVGANDGVFYARGGTLIPLQETQVRMDKEVLKFFVKDFEYMDVEVNFDFYNPGKSKTVTVGFVTPPASGDVDENKKHPRISSFTVNVNGANVPFKVKRMRETSFKADDREIYGTDYVYYFPVTFKAGLNKIRHTYRFLGGASVETQRDFDYQITTGKRWANKQITDFELQIHLDRGIYYIPLSFEENGEPAEWKIIGRGSFSKPISTPFSDDEKPTMMLAQIQDGYLSLIEKNFKPARDISIGEYSWNIGWYKKMCIDEDRCTTPRESFNNFYEHFSTRPGIWGDEESLKTLTAEELQIARNFMFAIRGYDFQSPLLKAFYSQFFWYKPNPELKLSDVRLSQAEELFLKKVASAEIQK